MAKSLKSVESSLRILQLCHKPPRPARDGGCLAMDALTSGLMDLGHPVQILTASTHKHPFSPESLTAKYLKDTQIQAVPIDTRIRVLGALRGLLTGKSYNVSRFHTPSMNSALRERLANDSFDVILVESLFMAPYIHEIRKQSDALVILRAHNVEHQIWSDLAQSETRWMRRIYLSILAKQLKAYESRCLSWFDAILNITEADLSTFKDMGCDVPMLVAPFGMDFGPPSSPKRDPLMHAEVFHLGAMDWAPNLQAVDWLVSEIWPKVQAAVPEARLKLAGKAFPRNFRVPHGLNIDVLGEIQTAETLLNRPAIMAIPLRSGSGMRIKAIEGAAAGLPIVSTTMGAEGLFPIPPFVLCDDAEAFAAALVHDLTFPKEAMKRGLAGQKWAHKHHHNANIVDRFVLFCHQLRAS